MSTDCTDNSSIHHATYARTCRMHARTYTNRKQDLSVGTLISSDSSPKINNNHITQVMQFSIISGIKALRS